MRDVPSVLDTLGVSSITTRPRQTLIESRTDLLAQGEWGWEELRDYTASQIEKRWGLFPRDHFKERSIFQRFVKDWGGTQAESIARYVFEDCDGTWEGRPMNINRFCRGSDPFFAIPIAERLARLT